MRFVKVLDEVPVLDRDEVHSSRWSSLCSVKKHSVQF